ncbi:hypothetical protein D7X33_26025 [Butyricicoccus sp. 1XD8-22]|nr:hypothetical protein D7X33_26025 [Butyricicoccus sp. 1XD8-22]
MTKDKTRFSKPVAFNKTKAVDIAIIDYVKRKNFSGYVKKLIIADMKNNGVEVPKKNVTIKTNETKPQQTSLDQLKQQLANHINKSTKNDSNS